MSTTNSSILSRYTLLAVLMCIFFIACDNDDDTEPQSTDTNEIVGVWQVVSITPETAGTSIEILELIPQYAPCIDSLKFTFTSDNKVSLSDCESAELYVNAYLGINERTSWKVENGLLKLTTDETVKEFTIIQETNQTKILVNTNTSGSGDPVNAVILLKRV